MHSLGSSNKLQRKGSETLSDLPKSPQLIGDTTTFEPESESLFNFKAQVDPQYQLPELTGSPGTCSLVQGLPAPSLHTGWGWV